MTIKECIDLVDNNKPNTYSIEEKVQWLSFIDEIIINDVLKTHEGYDGKYDGFNGYSVDNLSTPLIVRSPYDRLYPAYLKMKIDGENGETARYNNSASLFNSYLMEYRKYYNKTHMPVSGSQPRPPMTQGRPSEKLTDQEYENLKRDLFNLLSEHFADRTSPDKIYDVVKNYISTNIEMFKVVQENTVSSAKIGEIVLTSKGWVGKESPYSQVVSIEGVTENSQVDLTPSAEQLAIFHKKDLAFVTENDDGVVTIYAIGQKPQNDYTIQVTITETEGVITSG